MSGGALALAGGLVIEMCRMNKILEIDYVNQRAVVQPGLVNLQDLIHMAHFDNNATVEGEGAPTQAGASTTGHKGKTMCVGQFDDGHDLLCGAWEDHSARWGLIQRMPIAFIDQHLFRR